MSVIKIGPFSGIAPRVASSLLDATQAQIANNVRLNSGALRPLRSPDTVPGTVMTASAKTIYRLLSGSSTCWLSWANEVNVALSPVADRDEGRIYYTGDGIPKKTWYALASAGAGPFPGATAWQDMATPAYTTAPTLAAIAGTVPAGSYFYLVTLLNQFGPAGAGTLEESMPSALSAVITLGAPGGVRVTKPGGGLPSGQHNYTGWRVYRSTASGDFKLVSGDIAIATTTFDDTVAATLPTVLPSITWSEPPTDMQGLVALPDGFMAAFRDNELLFSEPNFPHAWPPQYRRALPCQNIVALAVSGSMLVVLTTGKPFVLVGTHPASMNSEELSTVAPCIASRSVMSIDGVVYYATDNGLGSISASGQYSLATRPLYGLDEWNALSPSTMFSGQYYGDYIGVYDDVSQTPTVKRAIWMQPHDVPPLVGMQPNATAFLDGYFVGSADSLLHHMEASAYNYESGEWRSKRFILPANQNLAVMQVDADFGAALVNAAAAAAYTAALAANQALLNDPGIADELDGCEIGVFDVNGDSLLTLPQAITARSVTVTLICDGQVRYSRNVTSNNPFKLPAGFRCKTVEISVQSNIDIYSVTAASSMEELRGVQ